MSAKKVKKESNIILSINKKNTSKSYIIKSLRKSIAKDCCFSGDDVSVLYDNEIIIGMYKIKIEFYFIKTEERKSLRDWGRFRINLLQMKDGFDFPVTSEKVFHKYQTGKYDMTIKSLVDLIHLCCKVNDLKVFL